MEVDPLARVAELERHVARLDAEVGELRALVGRSSVPSTVPSSVPPDAPPAGSQVQTRSTSWAPPPAFGTTPSPAWPEPSVAAPARPRPSFAVDSETLLKWGGVGLVVLAVGFAVSTAISRGWIGPELQLAGAILVSLTLIGTGLRLRPTRPGWTHALCSGGVLALFTTVASDLFLEHAADSIAFGSTVAIGTGGLALARSIRSEWVGVATLAGGAIGWAVIGDGEPPFAVTVVWYVLFVAAVVAVGVECRWFGARLAAHGTAMIVMLALAAEAASTSDRLLVGVATILMVGSLFSVPSIGDTTSVWQQLEIQLAAATTPPWAFAVTFVSTLEPEGNTVVGWAALAFAAAAAGSTIAVRSRLRPAHVVSLLIGASVTTSIGLAVLLSTAATFVALAVQGAGLVVLSRTLDRNVRVLINAAVLVAIATVYVIGNTVDAWVDDVSVGDDIAHAFIITAIALAGWLTGLRVVHLVTAALTLALVLVWTGSVLVHLPQGQAVVSIVWAMIGTAVFVTGAVRKIPEVGVAGLAVLGLTVGKLLTVDLREVDTLWRAGLFFLVGVGLMRLGFMLPRLDRGEAGGEPEETS